MPKGKKTKKTQNTKRVYKKKSIPKALREQVWITYVGNTFSCDCKVSWCKNKINVFDFHVGHDIPESKGGKTTIDNLKPICSRCNLSMGANYSITEWEKEFREQEGCCIVNGCNIM